MYYSHILASTPAAFQAERFHVWLTNIDAKAGYDLRCSIAGYLWRELFDANYTEDEAIRILLGDRIEKRARP